MKIGQIVTNGINFWMIWRREYTGCSNCQPKTAKYYVVPVILNKDETEIDEICFSYRGEYWRNKELDSIKPTWEIKHLSK